MPLYCHSLIWFWAGRQANGQGGREGKGKGEGERKVG